MSITSLDDDLELTNYIPTHEDTLPDLSAPEYPVRNGELRIEDTAIPNSKGLSVALTRARLPNSGDVSIGLNRMFNLQRMPITGDSSGDVSFYKAGG